MHTVIHRHGRTYLVSTQELTHKVWETMIFPCTPSGDVTDWTGLHTARYRSADSAQLGHESLVSRWEADDVE